MRPSALMVILFVVILAVSAIVHIPASFVYSHSPKTKDLSIGGLSGSVWNGAANNISFQGQPLGNLTWRMSALKLLTGNLALDFNLSGVSQLTAKGQMSYGISGFSAENLKMSAPSEMFRSFVPYPYPMDFSGPVEVNVASYEVSTPICSSLSGHVAWPGQISSPLGNIDLGIVMAKLSCSNGSIAFKGDSGSDAMQTDFTLKIGPKNGAWSFNGWLIPGSALATGIKTQLGWLGKPDNEGRYMMNFSGN